MTGPSSGHIKTHPSLRHGEGVRKGNEERGYFGSHEERRYNRQGRKDEEYRVMAQERERIDVKERDRERERRVKPSWTDRVQSFVMGRKRTRKPTTEPLSGSISRPLLPSAFSPNIPHHSLPAPTSSYRIVPLSTPPASPSHSRLLLDSPSLATPAPASSSSSTPSKLRRAISLRFRDKGQSAGTDTVTRGVTSTNGRRNKMGLKPMVEAPPAMVKLVEKDEPVRYHLSENPPSNVVQQSPSTPRHKINDNNDNGNAGNPALAYLRSKSRSLRRSRPVSVLSPERSANDHNASTTHPIIPISPSQASSRRQGLGGKSRPLTMHISSPVSSPTNMQTITEARNGHAWGVDEMSPMSTYQTRNRAETHRPRPMPTNSRPELAYESLGHNPYVSTQRQALDSLDPLNRRPPTLRRPTYDQASSATQIPTIQSIGSSSLKRSATTASTIRVKRKPVPLMLYEDEGDVFQLPTHQNHGRVHQEGSHGEEWRSASVSHQIVLLKPDYPLRM